MAPPGGGGGSSSRAEEEKRQSLSELFAERRLPFVGVAIAAGGLGAYVAYLAMVFLRASPQTDAAGASEPVPPTGLPGGLSRATAAEFDTSLDFPEWLMGVSKQRRRLAAMARGHVLEVAVGTGRNLSFYDWDDVAADDSGATDAAEGHRRLRQLGKTGYRPAGSADDRDRAVSAEMTSFTGVDISADVLEVARAKVRSAVPGAKQAVKRRRKENWGRGPVDAEGRVEIASAFGGRLRLILADAQDVCLPPPPPHVSSLPAAVGGKAAAAAAATAPAAASATKYDTILQTFGLCSMADPAALLANLSAVLRPGTGRIVLLEHGRGSWGAVNRLLDRYAPRHFDRFGCWWNRDIERIVRDAAAAIPGLEVVHVRRPGLLQAGTTLWIELRLNPVAER